MRLSPLCDTGTTFDPDSDPVVSVLFTPPDGARSIVVVAHDCAALQPQLAQCRAQSPTSSVSCVVDPELAVGDAQRLRFHFPDTDALIDRPDDDRTLTGPTTIAVTRHDAPLPCDLADRPCAGHGSLLACIDTLFAIDGTCGTTADPTFSHFTALPPPNDYQAVCVEPSPPCTGRASEFRFTVDAAGNVLIPMDWRGILVGQSVPVARLLRGMSAVAAFPESDRPISIPSNAFLHSFSPEGGLLPPIFEPQVDPSSNGELTLFGSADAPATVLRLARRSPAFRQCTGGSAAGVPCVGADDCPGGRCEPATCAAGARSGVPCQSDADCPGGECGASLFDFRSRLAAGRGPVLVQRFGPGTCQSNGATCSDDAACGGSRCVVYRLQAQDPAPLDGLIESPNLFVSVVPEAIEGKDLNGDGDTLDDVVMLADRRTGVRQPIGIASAPGRAATRIDETPFSYPAVLVEGTVVAFLEAEPAQGGEDANGDGDEFDTILRVFQNAESGAQELTAGTNLAVDAEQVINGRSLAISDGLVFFRTPEAAAVRRVVSRASVAANNASANGRSEHPSLSKNGRQVAFESTATNLLSGLTTDQRSAGPLTSYVHDRVTGRTARLRVLADAVATDAATVEPWLSGDGRYAAVTVPDVAGLTQIFVVDRDADGNGIFDEPAGIASVPISINGLNQFGQYPSSSPALSPDGRYVAFVSLATTLFDSINAGTGEDPRFPHYKVILHDRDVLGSGHFDQEARNFHASLNNSQEGATDPPIQQPPALSADGRYVAFADFDPNLAILDTNTCLNVGTTSTSCADIILRDRAARRTLLVSQGSNGEQSNNQSVTPAMSTDGRYIAFESAANTLVAGDTNGAIDVFVHDRATQTTTRVSVSSAGEQANASSFDRAISVSDSGRFIAFSSRASNLVPDDTNDSCDAGSGAATENCADIFVHDRLTGFTERVSQSGNTQGDGAARYPSMSADGSVVAFESDAGNLVPGDNAQCHRPDGTPANCTGIFVSEPDPSAVANDLTGDGDLNDTVLQVFDTARPEAGPRNLGPAGAVAVANRRAAFLMPESAINPASHPQGTDLNGDGDARDTVVHFFDGSGVQNLQRAAIAVALSESWIVALVSEADQGHADLNGDGDTVDTVVQVASVTAPQTWRNLGQAARVVDVVGSVVAFITPEAAQQVDLNGDGDMNDEVLQVYDAAADTLINTGQAAEEFVLGQHVIAFRTSEAAQGNHDLNGDGDTTDFVMQVYDLIGRRVIDTGQAAIPCNLAACDPRLPYRVLDDAVKFLTLEEDQGEDLNGDGDQGDLVLQTFNVPQAVQASGIRPASRTTRYARTRSLDTGVRAGALTTVGAVSAGICTDSGRACATAAECGLGGKCFLPPGGCVLDLGITCDPALTGGPCAAGQFCVPSRVPGKGSCNVRQGDCSSDADCIAPARCRDAGQSFQRLVNPLFGSGIDAHVFTASGRLQQLVVAAAPDSDGDGIADPFDNCPSVANPNQADANDNGIGDVCEASTAAPPASFTPTVTATATPAASPSATATASRTPIATSSPAAAATAVRHDGDGCTLTPAAGGGHVVPLGLGLVLIIRRRRRRSRVACTLLGSIVSIGLVAATAPRAAAGDPACAVSCDGSGAAPAEGLLTMIRIALGQMPLAECGRGDENSDGQIRVDELERAVLCAGRAASVPAATVAGAAHRVASVAAELPTLVPLISAVLGSAGDSDVCPLGGAYASTCVDTGTDFIRFPIITTQCRLGTIEGALTLNGTSTLSAVGLCPDLIVPGSVSITFDGNTTLESPASLTPILESQIGLDVAVEGFAFGTTPCRVRGATVILDGQAAYDSPAGQQVQLEFGHLHTVIQLSNFQVMPACDPATVTTIFDGRLRITDRSGTEPVFVDATLQQLSVTFYRLKHQVAISGGIVDGCAGGLLTVSTVTPLGVTLGQQCFSGGTLDVDSARGRLRLAFAADGGVQLDDGADGSVDATFSSCVATPLRACSDAP